MKKENLVIILNSPAGSGKDEVAKYLSEKYEFQWVEFKSRAVEIVRAVFGISELEWEQMYTRESKEIPHWKLRLHRGSKWLSPREALIFISEEIVKPKLGKNYFAECTLEAMKDGMNVVISDAGFIEEILTISETCDNVVKVSLEREGCSYEGDSRSPLPDGMFSENYHINNNFTKGDLYKSVDSIIRSLNI